MMTARIVWARGLLNLHSIRHAIKGWFDRFENRARLYKVANNRLTQLLAGNVARDFKHKHMLVYRSENSRALRRRSRVCYLLLGNLIQMPELLEQFFRIGSVFILFQPSN
jgi:hypothetical protein